MKIDKRSFAKPELDKVVVAAVKSLAKGEASPRQQVDALEFILHGLCVTDGLSYRPDDLGGERDSAFAEGRRFVGLQLREIVLLPYDRLVPEPKVTNG